MPVRRHWRRFLIAGDPRAELGALFILQTCFVAERHAFELDDLDHDPVCQFSYVLDSVEDDALRRQLIEKHGVGRVLRVAHHAMLPDHVHDLVIADAVGGTRGGKANMLGCDQQRGKQQEITWGHGRGDEVQSSDRRGELGEHSCSHGADNDDEPRRHPPHDEQQKGDNPQSKVSGGKNSSGPYWRVKGGKQQPDDGGVGAGECRPNPAAAAQRIPERQHAN
jgi:hypothetical protein